MIKNKSKIIKRIATYAVCTLLFTTVSMTAFAYSTPSSLPDKGVIKGNGVRLRTQPNDLSSSTVLELMYKGEEIFYNRDYIPLDQNPDYRYLKRVQTGTKGWCDDNFIKYTGTV